VLLASKGCLQTGYNVYMVDRVIFYDRAWTQRLNSSRGAAPAALATY
jgi:hypothetical protein